MSGSVRKSVRQDCASRAFAIRSGGVPVTACTTSTTRSRMRRPPTVRRPLGVPPYRRAGPPASTAPRAPPPFILVAPPALSLQDDVEPQDQAEMVVVLAPGRRDGEIVGGARHTRHRIDDVPHFEAKLVSGADRGRQPGRGAAHERRAATVQVLDDLPLLDTSGLHI